MNGIFWRYFFRRLEKYREAKLAEVGFKAEFSLQNIPTKDISKDSIEFWFQTKIVAINGEKLDETFVGRDYTETFFKDLPSEINVCGENGEVNSFCF